MENPSIYSHKFVYGLMLQILSASVGCMSVSTEPRFDILWNTLICFWGVVVLFFDTILTDTTV